MARRRKTIRERLEAAVERAIGLLDELDGDADFEPSILGGYDRKGVITDDREGSDDDMEGDGLEHGEYDLGEYDCDSPIGGGGYRL